MDTLSFINKKNENLKEIINFLLDYYEEMVEYPTELINLLVKTFGGTVDFSEHENGDEYAEYVEKNGDPEMPEIIEQDDYWDFVYELVHEL